MSHPGDPTAAEPAGVPGRSLALACAAISTLMAIAYTALVTGEGERPLWWVLAILLGSAALAVQGSRRRASHRPAWLLTAGIPLLGLGFLAVFSIGVPIMVAGLLALFAAGRAPR